MSKLGAGERSYLKPGHSKRWVVLFQLSCSLVPVLDGFLQHAGRLPTSSSQIPGHPISFSHMSAYTGVIIGMNLCGVFEECLSPFRLANVAR